MGKSRHGLIYVTNACVPEKVCGFWFCECLRYTHSLCLMHIRVLSVYYIKESCDSLFGSIIIILWCTFLGKNKMKQSRFVVSCSACTFYTNDHRKTSNLVNLMQFGLWCSHLLVKSQYVGFHSIIILVLLWYLCRLVTLSWSLRTVWPTSVHNSWVCVTGLPNIIYFTTQSLLWVECVH